jgi:hypothetical protein
VVFQSLKVNLEEKHWKACRNPQRVFRMAIRTVYLKEDFSNARQVSHPGAEAARALRGRRHNPLILIGHELDSWADRFGPQLAV